MLRVLYWRLGPIGPARKMRGMSTPSAQSLQWQFAHDDDPHRPTCGTCGVEKSLIRLSRRFRQGDLREDRIYQCVVCGLQDELIVRS